MSSYPSESTPPDVEMDKESGPKESGPNEDDPHFINFETISLPEDLLDMWGMFEGWDPFWICVAGAVLCLILMVCSSNIMLPFLMVCFTSV